MPLQQGLVASRAPSRVQRGGVSGAIIGGVWDQSEMGQLTVAQFVEYLAWLGVSIRIVFLCLKRAEDVQRATCEFRIDQDVLERDDQTVASEWRDEPGKPGGRHEDGMIRALDREAERGHVLKCAAKKAIELFIAGLNFSHGLQPIRQGFGVAGVRMVFNAVAWRCRMLVVIRQGREKACMPGFSRFERDLEADHSRKRLLWEIYARKL